MTNHVVGPKILKKEQVLISIFLISILVLSSGSMVAFARSNTYLVKPNGTDDTVDIQAAFNACGTRPGCTVQLVAGTYYVSQIAVTGFQGRFVGMGQGVTIIQALPNLPSPTEVPPLPFYVNPPTWSGGSNPWPDLFTFVNGAFTISGMTITDPYANPTQGWYDNFADTTWTALCAVIMITGVSASAVIDHVTVLGASGDVFGSNVDTAIEFVGFTLPPGWTDSIADLILLSGSFSVTNSVFDSVASGPFPYLITSASVNICYNTITNTLSPIGFVDASNSKLTFCGNRISNVQTFVAFEALQSVFKSGLLPSTAYVTGNNFQVGGGANAVWLQDYGTPLTLNAVVSGNVMQTDTSCGCYDPTLPQDYSAIVSYPLKSVVLSLNAINGAGAAGIYLSGGPGQVTGNIITGANTGIQVDTGSGVNVAANLIKNSAQWGIALTGGSSNNHIVGNLVHGSGSYDLYWDGLGTSDHWCGNVYKTSNFLPSC